MTTSPKRQNRPAGPAPAKSTSRSALRRQLVIHRALLRDDFPNATTLGRALEVSVKTIHRDIATMRNDMGFPIEWDAEQNGYYYTCKDFSRIPFLNIPEGAALALFVSHQALAQYRGTPFERPLQTAFLRLAEQMDDVVTFSPVQIDQYVTFSHTGRALTALEIYDGIMGALLDQRTVRFLYRKLEDTRARPRTVQPWHLACINNQWYLFAWDLDRKAVRTFVLGRIRKIIEYGENFDRPSDFSPAKLLADSFGVFKGTGSHHVELEFDAFGAQLVRERHWHDSQEIEELPGGRLILRLRLGALEELDRWVLSFGEHVTVRRPAALRKRVQAAARKMAGLGEEGSGTSSFRTNEPQIPFDPEQPDGLREILFHLAARTARDHPDQLDLPL